MIVLASVVLLSSPIRAQADIETTVQTALEGVPSGVALGGVADDGVTPISVRPTRTWKSKTGHFCRAYEVHTGGPNPGLLNAVRCREVNGGWAIPIK